MSPDVTAFFHEPTNTVSYVVSDPSSGACAVIDPVCDYEPNAGRTGTASADEIIAFVRSKELTAAWIIETHAHADHLTAAPYLREALGGRIAIGERITTVQETFGRLFNAGDAFRRDGSQFDHLFADGEGYRIGDLDARALHTPGHTPACMTHVIGDAAFVGDTLFMPDYGTARTDFPGGDAVTGARTGQQTPQGYYNIERMLKRVLGREGRVLLCGTCMDARGFIAEDMLEGAERSTMDELAAETSSAETVLVF